MIDSRHARIRSVLLWVTLAVSVLLTLATQSRAGQISQGQTIRAAPAGVDPNGPSSDPSVAGNGFFVAFASQATNLGPVVGNGRTSKIYVFNLLTGRASLVSIGLGGQPANGPSRTPSISADGNVTAFVSRAGNLVAGTSSRFSEVYKRTGTGPITLVSRTVGDQPPNGGSGEPAISADGRFVAFTSSADNLIAGDQNASSDVFVADLAAGTLRRVSVSSSGGEANGASSNPSISGDGRLVSFTSAASNLVPGDRNHVPDVFVHDQLTGHTQRVSVSTGGRAQNASVPAPFTQISGLSAGGRYIVFDSNATNLVRGATNGHTDVFRHDLMSGQTSLVSRGPGGKQGDNDSFAPATSADGHVTVFESFADNLASPWVPNENVFAQDLVTGTTVNLDVTPTGAPRGPELDFQLLQQAAVSASGRVVAFTSGADNLVANDYNGANDVFLRVFTSSSSAAHPDLRRRRSRDAARRPGRRALPAGFRASR